MLVTELEREMADELDLESINPEDHDNPQLIRQLRDAAQRNGRAAKEGQEAIRKLAFFEAGVDLTTPQGKLLAKGYDGKLDDVAAIQAAWEEVKPQAAVPPPAAAPGAQAEPVGAQGAAGDEGAAGAQAPGAQAPAVEDTGSATRRALGDGVTPVGAPTGDARERLLDTASKARQHADWDHAAGGLIHGIVQGFKDGEIPALAPNGRRQA